MTNLQRGQLAGLTAAVLFGCSAPLITTLSGQGSALSIAGLLYAGASLALLLIRGVRRGLPTDSRTKESPVTRSDWLPLASLTLMGGVVGPLALVLGLARLTPAAGSLLLNLESVFTLVIAVMLGREHLGRHGFLAAVFTICGAVVLSEGSLSGATWQGAGLIALATLAWGIDNNISQRLSLRDPIQIATIKAIGASVPMLLLSWLLEDQFPSAGVVLSFLLIGSLGYGISIWLDLLALRHLGAARESVIFSTAPFVGAAFSVLVLRQPLTPLLGAAALLMAGGVAFLLREDHGHWHRHEELEHAHRHFHSLLNCDPHHEHPHTDEDLAGTSPDKPFWHAHPHRHEPIEHEHPHVSDAHHRHQH